jgi:hypothetical protein
MSENPIRLAVIAIAALAWPSFATAGDLTPPGAPAPTMRTLTELEPRIPVGPLTTPGDADSVYRIDQPGSYFLTGDVGGEVGKHGIEIVSPDVSLDLMGFTLRGVAGSLDGISIFQDGGALIANIRLRDGTVRGFGGGGVSVGSGIETDGPPSVYERVAAVGNGGLGIEAYRASLIDCFATGNGSIGFFLNAGASAERCAAIGNGQSGFQLGSGSVVTACLARENGGRGFDSFGASAGRVLRDCVAERNGDSGFFGVNGTVFEGCIAIGDLFAGATINGFRTTGDGNRFVDCIARSHTGAGFLLVDSGAGGAANLLTGCVAERNLGEGFSVEGPAIFTTCSAISNVGAGFISLVGMTATDCTALDNNGAGFQAAVGASIRASTARGNLGPGIAVSIDSVVADCVASGNESGGIIAGSRSSVRRCDASFNQSPTTDTFGIRVLGNFARVEGNHCVQNDGPGILIDGDRNVIAANTVAFNNGSITINGTSNQSSSSSSTATAGPWQNITH